MRIKALTWFAVSSPSCSGQSRTISTGKTMSHPKQEQTRKETARLVANARLADLTTLELTGRHTRPRAVDIEAAASKLPGRRLVEDKTEATTLAATGTDRQLSHYFPTAGDDSGRDPTPTDVMAVSETQSSMVGKVLENERSDTTGHAQSSSGGGTPEWIRTAHLRFRRIIRTVRNRACSQLATPVRLFAIAADQSEYLLGGTILLHLSHHSRGEGQPSRFWIDEEPHLGNLRMNNPTVVLLPPRIDLAPNESPPGRVHSGFSTWRRHVATRISIHGCISLVFDIRRSLARTQEDYYLLSQPGEVAHVAPSWPNPCDLSGARCSAHVAIRLTLPLTTHIEAF
jgi:hypothetical protein